MSAVVKLSAALPGDFETNGIDSIVQELIDGPMTLRTALVWFDCPNIDKNNELGVEIPKIRVRRIEPLGEAGEVTQAVQDLVAEKMEARTGRKPLPFGIVEVGEQRHSEPIDGVDE